MIKSLGLAQPVPHPREIFGQDMPSSEPDEVNGTDEPLADVEEPPARHCPCCQVGVMVVVQRIARPRVQEIMEMTLDQLRQLPLPFT